MDTLTQFFIDHLPAAVVLVVISVIAFGVIVWWAAMFWSRLRNLPCKEHSSAIGDHSGRLESIASDISAIKGQMSILVQLLTKSAFPREEGILSVDESVFSHKQSPRRLNANGLKIFDAFGCSAFIESNREWLLAELAKLEPRNALDVESCSMAALRICSLDDRFNNLKNDIYRSPELEIADTDGNRILKTVTLDDVLFVMSLSVRDLYLAGHPELLD